MKKKFGYIAVLALAVSLCACGKSSNKKSISDYGMDVVAVMDEMSKSDAYGTIMSSSEDIKNIAVKIGEGDYTTPKAIYAITNLSDVEALLETYGDTGASEDVSKFSDPLKNYLNAKCSTIFITQMNGRTGVANLAAGSVYAADKLFVSDELKENTIYIYTFENGYPIAVCFKPGEDHAVYANGIFIMDTELTLDSAESLQNALHNEYAIPGCKVEKIK